MAQIILDSNNNLIQGDFDNATVNNRTKFKTTTTNATTNVYAVPNGSATSAGYSVANNADPTNCSKIVMATNGSTDTQIISGINGSGSYLPMSFYVNNTLALQISTAGVVSAPYGGFSGAGGMTLLGTLTPTAAANSISLGSLTLTNYKALFISFTSIATTAADSIYIQSTNATPVASSLSFYPSSSPSGIVWIDLATGTGGGGYQYGTTGGTYGAGGLTTISTATTTIYFRFPGVYTFTGTGTIKVYGVA
jgi:hypothetical protein